MKIACVGDSFSTTTYGQSWPDFVCNRYNAELVRVCNAGAGNAFYVEKVHDVVKQDIDLVIVQLTEPSRAVIGLRAWEDIQAGRRPHPYPEPQNYFDPTHSNIYKDIGAYTMNVHDNAQWLNGFVGSDCQAFDDVWLKQIAGTRYWDYQTLHSMLSIKALCLAFNKPVIWISWFVSWDELFVPGYEWLRTASDLVQGVGLREAERLNLPLTNCGHLTTDSSRQLVDIWLGPELDRYVV